MSHTAVQNTERANNLLVGALKQFPMEYIFNVVYRLKEVGISSQSAAMLLLQRLTAHESSGLCQSLITLQHADGSLLLQLVELMTIWSAE